MPETGISGPVFQPTGTAKLRYNSIQFLRCVAVIAVLVFHSHWAVKQELLNIPLLTNYGWVGVNLFFVISGFIISERIGLERSLRGFLFKRYMRVFPLYGLFTLIAIVLSLVFGWDYLVQARTDSGGEFNPDSVFYYLKSFFVIPQDEWPVFMIGWSLEYEMVFYFTFGVSYFLGGRSFALLMMLALALAGGAFPNFTQPLYDYNFYYFLFGCIAREVSRWNNPIIIIWSSLACVITGAGWILHLHDVINITDFGFVVASATSFAALVVACVSLEKSNRAFLRAGLLSTIGDMSFSLYLFHWLAVSISLYITGDTVFSATQAESIRISVIIFALVGAWAVWTFLEKPMNRLVRSGVSANRRPEAVRSE